MEQAIFDIRNVSYKLGLKTILDGINWKVRKGEHWAILGPNGAGKTTLLRVACGYVWPNAGGTVYRNGKALVNLRQLRKEIGWLTNSLARDIPPAEKVIRTVVSGKYAQLGLCEYQGQTIAKTDFETAERYLEEMNCTHLAQQRFGVLSQGEKQRVLISRARMARPYLMILDEPCAGLDPGGRELLLRSIGELAENQQKMGLILVTQHVEEILPIFENTLALKNGKLFESGPTQEVVCSDVVGRLYGIDAQIRSQNDRYWMTCP